MMDSILTKMIAENFMFATVVHNRFVGVKKACYGMKQKLVVVHRIRPRVLAEEKNGDKKKVGFEVFELRISNVKL